MAWEALKGQWTTLVTPFTPDDHFDREGMKRNIRHIKSLGTTGAGCTWGMGEFWSLTHDERIDVMDTVAEESAGDWLIAAHVTDSSAPEMLSLARHAEDQGFDLLVVAPPFMVTKTEDQVVEYVRLLAENTNLAIMFYNSPQFGIVMSTNGLERLCRIPQRRRHQRGQLQSANLYRGPPDPGQGSNHKHSRRVDLLQSAGIGLPAAGDVLQQLRLAVRRSWGQLLRPVYRPGHQGRLGRGLLRPAHTPVERAF